MSRRCWFARATTSRSGRMLIGFDFGAAPKRWACLPPRGVAVHEMWSNDDQHDHEHRQGVHELEGPPSVATAWSASLRSRTKASSRAPATRLVIRRLHLADPGRLQPVPVPAARRRAHPLVGRREGAWTADLTGRHVSLQLGWNRAAGVLGDQRHRQRHRPTRRLSLAGSARLGAKAHPAS